MTGGWRGWDDDWDDPDHPDAGPDAHTDEGPLPSPSPSPPPEPVAVLCWNCGHPVPACADPCPTCTSPRVHLVLTLDSPRLRAVAGPGRPLRLGRDPRWAPATAPDLTGSPGVSRRHATITVDHDGTAWLAEGTPAGSLNGTWLNGHRIEPTTPQRLKDRDRLRLGHRVHGTVRLHPSPHPSP